MHTSLYLKNHLKYPNYCADLCFPGKLHKVTDLWIAFITTSIAKIHLPVLQLQLETFQGNLTSDTE